jgi:hypothetical protein
MRPPLRTLLAALFGAVAFASCVQTVAVREVQDPLPEALVSTPRAAWRAIEGPRSLGFVLRFEPSSGRHAAFHSVRNVWNQELGLVDAEGRAWRYRPHAREPLWLGTGTVLDGTRAILSAGEDLELLPVDLSELQPR